VDEEQQAAATFVPGEIKLLYLLIGAAGGWGGGCRGLGCVNPTVDVKILKNKSMYLC
jgi:hypothetical protein